MQMTASRRSRKVALAATAATLAIFLSDPALAQDSGSTDETANAPKDAIVVIGTRRTDRTVTDSASPVDVIGATELQNQPSSNMLDTVKNVVPSFYVGQNSISDASTFVRAPSLRGLPADQVLVQINGKRLNRSALVQVYNGGDTGLSFGSQGADISSIPSISVKTLQVLRDGATAQYGSDAIAGVLNYELRSDAGIELQGRYGQYFDGGANANGKSYQIAGYFGFKISDRGFISLSGEYNDDGQTSRGATRPVAVAFATENPTLAATLPHYPMPAQIWGSSPGKSYKAMVNSQFELSDNAKLYFFGNVAHSKADQSFNFRSSLVGTRPFTTTGGGTNNLGGNSIFQSPYYLTPCPTGVCPAGGYIQNTNTWLASSLYPGGFTPRFVGVTDEAIGTLGIKGDSGKLHWDVSASLSRNSLDLSMYNSISPTYGPLSQTSFKFGKLIQKETTVNLDATYDLGASATPWVLSFGAEYRREAYTQTAGDPQSYGAGPFAVPHPLYTSAGVLVGTSTNCSAVGAVCTRAFGPGASGYGGTSPTYAGTHSDQSYGFYAGLEGDLSERLSVGVAGRFEHYDSSGSAVVGKANALFKVTDALSLRGTVGTGYHAPSPGQNNTQILTTNFIAGQAVQTGTFPVTSTVSQYFGAVPLKPEKSLNFGLGFVFKPSSAFTLTVDAYSIKVTDRIFISRNFTVNAADIVLQPALAGVGDGGVVQYFTNALDTKTQGVDVVGTYRTDFGGGKLNLTLAYNYNHNKVTDYDPLAIGPEQISDAENLAPKHRLNMSANWSSGPLSIGVTEHYYSSWSAQTDYPGQEFGAKWTTDLDISYTFADHFTLSVGSTNLFNAYPDKIANTAANPVYTITGSTADGQIYPRNGGPFGFNGGFWYGRVKIKF